MGARFPRVAIGRRELAAAALHLPLGHGLSRRLPGPYRVDPVVWLDEHPATWQLAPAASATSVGPTTPDGLRAEAAVPLPAVRGYRFRGGSVHPRSGAVVVEHGVVLERLGHVPAAECDYGSWACLAHRGRRGLTQRRAGPTLPRGFFLGGLGSFNYYHLMIELLPKLQHLARLEQDTGPLPLLVDRTAAEVPSFRRAIEALAPGHELVVLDADVLTRVGDLVLVNSPSLCAFNMREGVDPRPEHSFVRPESLRWVADTLAQAPAQSTPTDGPRVFFRRATSRRPYNEDAVFEVLQGYGFEGVEMAGLSLDEQVVLCRRATAFAGPTGAEWTNLLFASPGVPALCWMASQMSGFAVYANLAAAVGVDLRYHLYDMAKANASHLYQHSYRLDPHAIDRAAAATFGARA